MAERKIPVTDGLEENDQAVLRAMTLYADRKYTGVQITCAVRSIAG